MALSLKHTPLLRILIPFVIGIGIACIVHLNLWIWLTIIFVSAISYVCLSFSLRSPLARYNYQYLFSIPLFFICISLGAITTSFHMPQELDVTNINGKIIKAEIEDIQLKDFSMTLDVKISDKRGNNNRIRLNTRGVNYRLHEGDIIIFKANLSRTKNIDKSEFDYERYLFYNGIIYYQVIEIERIKKTGNNTSIYSLTKHLQRSIIHKINTSSLESDSRHFINAILLGERSYIDNDTRDQFSNAGVSHILALSGLHISIIISILWFLLFPFDYFGLRKFRIFITLIFILIFNILTGLSISVIRASIMITFVFIGTMLHRKNISLNALFGAALFILVFNPYAIFDISFQFSFITVLFILFCGERVLSMASRRKRIKFFFLSLIATSCIAMVSTSILSAFYFCTISWATIFSNLILLPILPIYMFVGVIHIILLLFGIDFILTNFVLNLIYDFIHQFINFVSHYPITHASGLYITLPEVLTYYLGLLFIIIWLYNNFNRNAMRLAIITFGALIIIHNLRPLFNNTPKIVIFNSPLQSQIAINCNHQAFIWNLNEDCPAEEFKSKHKFFIAKNSIKAISIIKPETTMKNHIFYIKKNFALIYGKRFIIAPKRKLRNQTEKIKLNCDYLIVTKNFYSSISHLCNLYDFSYLILSGDIYDEKLQALIDECKILNITPIVIKDSGTLQIDFN